MAKEVDSLHENLKVLKEYEPKPEKIALSARLKKLFKRQPKEAPALRLKTNIKDRDMNWLSDFVRPKIKKITTKEIADNLWTKCPECGQMLFTKELEKNNFVCTHCEHHLRLPILKRFEMLFDNGEYHLVSLPRLQEDPLNFKDSKKYSDRLKAYRKSTGSDDAIKVAQGEIGGITCVIAALDFSFMGGSMGTAVGEALLKVPILPCAATIRLLLFLLLAVPACRKAFCL